jgi:hypothetical protein
MNAAHIAFQGELQLLGWAESDKGGRTVKFQVAGEDAEHPFKRFKSKARFAVVLVEIGDDEQPVTQPDAPVSQTSSGLRLSNECALLCKDKDFWTWIGSMVWGVPIHSEQKCAEVVKDVLEIESRADLDRDEAAAARFITELLNPFRAWKAKALQV